MRIVLADGRANVRSALRLLLEQSFGCQIVGEAACITDLVSLTEGQHPDLVLLDWQLPESHRSSATNGAVASTYDSGQRILQQLKERWPALKVIVLSGGLEARQAALLAGADAFISKNDPPAHLLAAIRKNNGNL